MKNFTRFNITIDSLSAIILFAAIISAFIISNSPIFHALYIKFINLKISISVGEMQLSKTLLKWVNDGLMALFFFLLGLEMKYHLIEGEFKDRKTLILPFMCAVGGLIFPSLIYVFFNYNNAENLRGWAIPIATDTAFVLAIVSFFKEKVSDSAKVFLIGLSIIDDLFAVFILAFFYTPELEGLLLCYSLIPIIFLFLLNYFNCPIPFLYYISTIILWYITVQAGVHGTIAGIIAAFFIPNIVYEKEEKINLVKKIEQSIHLFVAFFVLPLFAFVNSEISLQHLALSDFTSNVTVGTFLGLLIGKPLGIYLIAMICIKFKICRLPFSTDKITFFAFSILCAIGFTLSIFIGLQAFEPIKLENQMKIGVISASFISAILGSMILKLSKNDKI